MAATIQLFRTDTNTELSLPFADQGIKAGFPSPAQDYMEESIDLNKALIKRPASTFLGRVTGDSMRDENILEGDILVIDKAEELQDNDLAVCYIDGEFTTKRVRKDKDGKMIRLYSANPAYPPIEVTKDNNFIIWGVVTYVITDPRKRR